MLRRTSLLAATAAAIALAAPSAASAATCANAGAMPGTPEFTATAEATTLCLLNNERAAAGLAPLREGPAELRAPAVAYARDMVERRFFAHETPDGIKLLQRLASYAIGTFWTVGENLAWGEHTLGTPEAIVRAWMNSPGHKRNILDGTFKEVGIGIVLGAPRLVSRPAATYVTEFGARNGVGSTTDAPASTGTTGTTASKTKTTAKKQAAKKKKAKAKRCKKVWRKVRRGGRTVKVKKTVCSKAAKKSAKKTAKKSKAARRKAAARKSAKR